MTDQAHPAEGIATRGRRRADLDWIRVVAVLLVLPFHAGNIFDPDPAIVTYVRDAAPVGLLLHAKDFLSRWQLEVLFLVAGAAAWYALGRRSTWRYLGERFTRLLVPFAFGLVVLVPLMVNARWLGQAGGPSPRGIYVRFFAQQATDLTGMDGSFTPSHLWFLLYLFLFSLLGLPLLRVLRQPLAQRALSVLVTSPVPIYLFVVPLTLGRMANLFGLGDKDPLYFFLIFAFGYAAMSQQRFQETVDRHLPLSVALALAATLAPPVLLPGPTEPKSPAWLASLALFRLSQWAWVLAILGAAHRWLDRDGRLLRYANEAALPFYILHLPVLTLVGWYAIQADISAGAKYALIVVVAGLLTLAIYDLIVRRVRPLRVCFGLKGPAPGARVGDRPRARRQISATRRRAIRSGGDRTMMQVWAGAPYVTGRLRPSTRRYTPGSHDADEGGVR